MSALKIHLELEELDAVNRLAHSLKVSPNDLAYVALHRLMLDPDQAKLVKEIAQTLDLRGRVLPVWSDSARSVHIYESKPDDEQTPAPGKRLNN
ncbi:MAG: hypothetical protein ABSE59_07815 [Opitutaceae bacterium]